jgi:ABC-type Fe3+/spermidine/putrescine transport system ATPase subunit
MKINLTKAAPKVEREYESERRQREALEICARMVIENWGGNNDQLGQLMERVDTGARPIVAEIIRQAQLAIGAVKNDENIILIDQLSRENASLEEERDTLAFQLAAIVNHVNLHGALGKASKNK